MKSETTFQKSLGWVVTILTPLMVLMVAVRLLISPVFTWVEYRLPGFPDDPYGFTLEDRLQWSRPSITYLVNGEGIDYLAALTFDNGDPIYNAEELSHMADVKAVVTGMRVALAVVAVALLLVVLLAKRQGWQRHLLLAFRRGGWGVVGLIAAILLFVALSFNQLFTWFHQIFFASGTWQFYTSDTLIRLFPMRFWQDAFIDMGVLSLLFGVLLILFCRPRRRDMASESEG